MTTPPDPPAHPEPVEGRTFTLKDFFNRDQAEAKMRAQQRRPFPTGDLTGAGLSFVEMPEAGAPLPGGGGPVRRVGGQTEEEVRLARDWVSRRPIPRNTSGG